MLTRCFVILLFLTFLINPGCRQRFQPDIDESDPVLVVDGILHNQKGPYTVTLSQSTQMNDPEFIPYQECRVTIMDDAGAREDLVETRPGVYKSKKDGLRGAIGKSYRLRVETPTGRVFQSDFQKMPPSTGIDSLYVKKEYRISPDEEIPDIPGYRFYVNTGKPGNDSTYFLWKMKETFEYTADHMLDAIFTQGEVRWVHQRDTLYRCWKRQKVTSFFTANTANLEGSGINGQPLHFVGSDSRRLQQRYSMLLQQYHISKEAYLFWKNLQDQLSEKFYLFSSQPYQIEGNITPVDDSQGFALGFFTVASVREKRLYVDRPDFEFYYDVCEPYPSIGSLFIQAPNDDTTYITEVIYKGNITLAIAAVWCIDCRSLGGELEKPEFWKDE